MGLFKTERKELEIGSAAIQREERKVLVDKMKKEVAEFRAFRGVGEKFNYMGIEVMVLSIYPGVYSSSLDGHYVDGNGVLRDIKFHYRDLENLIAENP